MMFEKPQMASGSELWVFLVATDVIFTVIYIVEAGLKIFALSFRRYAARTTNVIDLLVVISSALSVATMPTGLNIKIVRALRALRAFKPLRIITRRGGVRNKAAICKNTAQRGAHVPPRLCSVRVVRCGRPCA